MAHQQHGSFKIIDRHPKRLSGHQVQVICRLIQKEEVGSLPNNHGQYEPGFFPTTQCPHCLVDHLVCKAKGA